MAKTAGMILITALILLLAACGSLQNARQSPAADFPFRHSAFDLKVAWKIDQIDNSFLLNGLLKNVRYTQIEDVDLAVSVVDRENRTLAKNRILLLPAPILMDGFAPFGLTLGNVVLHQGDTLRFLIKYRANDSESRSFTWVSSFSVDALTGAAVNEEPVNSDRW